MGEYIYASIKFGGRVSRNQARKLAEIGNEYGLSVEGQGGKLSLDDVTQEWADDEINYGNLDNLTDYCCTHGIDHEHYHSSGPGWDAEREKVIAGQAIAFIETEDGAAVPIADLVKLDALATGWADLHTKIKLWARELPPVVLHGELTDEEDNDV